MRTRPKMIEPGPCVVRNNVISFAHEPVENTMRSNAFGLGGAGGVQTGLGYLIDIPDEKIDLGFQMIQMRAKLFTKFQSAMIPTSAYQNLGTTVNKFTSETDGKKNSFFLPNAAQWGVLTQEEFNNFETTLNSVKNDYIGFYKDFNIEQIGSMKTFTGPDNQVMDFEHYKITFTSSAKETRQIGVHLYTIKIGDDRYLGIKVPVIISKKHKQ